MLHHQPSSPTSSSVSSSDLDTESTGSFFHDRSTTLGTLMGVTFPAAIAFGAPPDQPRSDTRLAPAAVSSSSTDNNNPRKPRRVKKNKKKIPAAAAVAERRRRWWRLCRDGEAKPASLGDFLEVERRYGDAAFFNDEAAAAAASATEIEGVNGRMLFADGRVLPPAVVVGGGDGSSARGPLSKFPVSLSGICSGGVG